MREHYLRVRKVARFYLAVALLFAAGAAWTYQDSGPYLLLGGVALLASVRGCILGMQAFAIAWDMEDKDGDSQ